jgi:NAD(P)-dependent dehydrogenase (short-subunit alcohol dehydrogenase family)
MAAIYPDLEGKSVLVTGGGSGIGASIVRAFTRQKAKVGFLDIAREPSARLVDELTSKGHSVHYEYCDLTDIDQLRAAVGRVRTRIGPIRVLINNAAHDERHTTESVTPEYWDNRIAVNLKHQFFAAQAVLPDMQAASDGAIVNFGSISWMTGQGGMPVYTASCIEGRGVPGVGRSGRVHQPAIHRRRRAGVNFKRRMPGFEPIADVPARCVRGNV